MLLLLHLYLECDPVCQTHARQIQYGCLWQPSLFKQKRHNLFLPFSFIFYSILWTMAARCARGILLTYVFHFVFGGRWVLLPDWTKRYVMFLFLWMWKLGSLLPLHSLTLTRREGYKTRGGHNFEDNFIVK